MKPNERFWFKENNRWYLCFIENKQSKPCAKCSNPDCKSWKVDTYYNPWLKNHICLETDIVSECEMKQKPDTEFVPCAFCQEETDRKNDSESFLDIYECDSCNENVDYYCPVCKEHVFNEQDQCDHAFWHQDYCAIGSGVYAYREECLKAAVFVLDYLGITEQVRNVIGKHGFHCGYAGDLINGMEYIYIGCYPFCIRIPERGDRESEPFKELNQNEDDLYQCLIGIGWLSTLDSKTIEANQETIHAIDMSLARNAMRLVI